jgi:hypothetical protein
MKIIAWIIGLPIAAIALLMAIGALMKATDYQPSEKSQARSTIDFCWSEQSKKSNDPATARLMASQCERMESEFKTKYGVNP